MSQDGRDRPALPYLPGLDGLRGAALASVLVYHLDRTWLPGGVLGMTVFFTLSGFLITTLILREIDETGGVDLRAFWLRRARRLAPAAVAAVGVIAVLVRLAGTAVDRTLVGDAVGALTWTANWRFITSGSSYAQVFEHPSPFQHFWSLAIEEQLYVVLPLLALALLGGGRRRWLFATVVVAGVAASTAAGIALHGPGHAPSRAYFGTDARIAEPLVGALLAVVMVRTRGLRQLGSTATRALGAAALLAVAGVLWLMWSLSISDDALYRGGFLVTALASAVIVAAATQRTFLARVLSAPPLVGLGRISYGVYLFHWPLFLFLEDRLRHEGRGAVMAAQLASTLAVALVSYTVLELPIRRRQRNAGVFAVGWANASVAMLAVVALCAVPASAAPAVADLGPSVDAAVPPPPTLPPPAVETARAIAPAAAAAPVAAGTRRQPTTTQPPVDVADDPIVGGGSSGPSAPAPSPTPAPRGNELRVVVIGDSLGHNLGVGLADWAEARGDVLVYNLAIAGCPLSRGGERRFDASETFQIDPKCGWWGDTYSERAQDLATFDPDVVVVADGLNELLDRKLPEWSDWRRPGDPSYHEWLLSEYGNVITAIRGLAGDDTDFLFLNAPCADFERLSNWRRVDGPADRVMALDRAVYPVVVGATQGDLFSELCPNGQYADTLWGVEDARPDGIHLSDEASDELARRWLGPKVLDVAANGGQPVDLGG